MKVSFILGEPATPENVGAAAHALKTMGFTEMILVNPCDHLSEPARWLAHASNDILENARVANSLNKALEGFDFIIGSTAKNPSVKHDYFPHSQLPVLIKDKGASINKIAVIFTRDFSKESTSWVKTTSTYFILFVTNF